MRRLVYLIAVAALAVPSTAAAQSGTIAFHQKTFDDSSSDLWLATADGTSGAVRLTSPQSAPDPTACFDACGAEAPDWTPDGSRLYFDSSWTPFVHIWSMRPDGTDARQETFSTGFDGFPVGLGGRQHDRLRLSDDVDDPSLSGIYLAPSTRRRLARPADRRSEARVRHQPRLLAGRQAGRVPARSSSTSARRRAAASGTRPASPPRSGSSAPTAPACTRSSAAARSGATRTTARTARAS